MDLEKRVTLDFINVFYYFRYRISLLLSWISRHIGMILSDIYFSRREHGLIEQKNIDLLVEGMSPGDICITRRNWAATNMSIPGFWKHMSMYIGTGEYLKNNFPEFLSIVAKLENNIHYIIEAVGSGVQITPLDVLTHHNDYIAVMRTRFSSDKIRRAIKKAITGTNAGYDFSFNYYSDINHVCSALVTKAYLPDSINDEGLHITLTRIGTGITYPPNDIVKKFGRELHRKNQELDFVGFIDFIEKNKHSFISTEKEFLKTISRSRLSIFLS